MQKPVLSKPDQVAPGRLVFVVGPSGVGKDTLLSYARQCLLNNDRVRFVQRVITRPLNTGEDHLPMEVREFETAREAGSFALSWDAHGLRYGLPIHIDCWIAQGKVVVANGSRAIVQDAARRYPRLQIIQVSANREVLAARLAQRGREDQRAQHARLIRSDFVVSDFAGATVIENSGDISLSGRRFVEALLSD